MQLTCALLSIVAMQSTRGAESHWAFAPPERPEVPIVTDPGACRNAVDHFVLSRLEEEGRSFSESADRYTLVRRLSIDLRGIPPTLPEVERFAADNRPDAYERLVDAFLADSAFGEKMASFWLDLARFGDTNGYQDDGIRTMWLYRDYVIDAFNQNMPFDQFTIENLAGDLLPNATLLQRIASGFNRNHRFNEEGGSDPEEFRVVYAVDRTNTTATTWLGLTFECAQCHDHKYDPISQREYYSFYAFFNNNKGELGVSKTKKQPPFLELPTAEEKRRRRELAEETARVQEESEQHRAALDQRFARWLASPELEGASREEAEKDKQLVAALRKASVARDENDRKRLRQFYVRFFESEEQGRVERLQELRDASRRLERSVATTLVMEEMTPRRETFILERGDFRRPGEKVEPGLPSILPPLPGASSDRLALARSFVDPRHPLVARVLVNRLWYQLFGRGIVPTLNDFGVRGAPPSHPVLLDWLATEAIRRGWDLKELLRVLLTSTMYRQASRRDPSDDDDRNRDLHRAPRYRLRAEEIRDNALAIAGLLSRKIGGVSVMPEQPAGYFADKSRDWRWTTSAGDDRYRRAVYTFWRRTTPYPSLMFFDAPSREFCVAGREETTTAQQALVTLNDPAFFGAARAFAERIRREGPGDLAGRLDFAIRLALARPSTPRERRVLAVLYRDERSRYADDPDAVHAVAGGEGEGHHDLAALTSVANAILNLDEVICRE